MNSTPPGTETGGAGTGQHPPKAPWRFVRRERGRVIAGVATGMADAFHVDVVVMRVIWVVLGVASFGLGVAAYAICWLAFPSDEHPAPLNEILRNHDESRRHTLGFVVGLGLFGLGLLIVFGEVFRPFRHGHSVIWAVFLIGAGLAVLLLRRPEDDLDEHPVPPAAPPWTPGPAAGTGEPAGSEPQGSSASPTAPTPTNTTPTTSTSTTGAPSFPPPPPIPPSAWTQSTPWPIAPTPRVRKVRPRAFLTPLTLSLLLIGGGVVTLLDNNGTAHFTAAEILAGALCVVGAALLLSTWFGRARGLVPLGILLLLATVPAATIDVPLTGGTGNRTYDPTTRSELRSKYELGIGHLTLDLRGVPLAARKTKVRAQLGIGNLEVDVPSTVKVVVHGHAGAGAVLLFGGNDGGWPENQTRSIAGTGPGELDLDLRVGAGAIQVHRFEPDGAETIFSGEG